MDTAPGGIGQDPAVRAARRALTHWVERIGVPGFAAMQEHPGLLSEVDQHRAAVTDTLAGPDGAVTEIDLAAYADGVCDSAAQRGRSLVSASRADWTRAPWQLVRLLAICVIAHERGLTG
jgi:hypothetical protein